MKIAIIGAGITGLSAAKTLHDHGINVTVFDKARGKGGRLTTKRLDMGAVNIGAQYFTSKHPDFTQQINDWVDLQQAALWDFIPSKIDNGILIASPDSRKRYVGVNGMRSLTHSLSEGLHIEGNTRITKVHSHEGKHTLIDHNGTHHEDYNWVICTLPAEQTKILFKNTPHICNHIDDDIHAPCCAVTLATTGQINRDIQGIFGDDTIAWVSRLSSQPLWERPIGANYDDIWELHFTPSWSQAHHALNKEDIINTAQQWLEKHTNTTLTLNDSYYHFWKYANLTNKNAKHAPVISIENTTIATGAWCFGGRVEGGYLAGLHAAKTLLKKEAIA